MAISTWSRNQVVAISSRRRLSPFDSINLRFS
jgi:hypothetical protein